MQYQINKILIFTAKIIILLLCIYAIWFISFYVFFSMMTISPLADAKRLFLIYALPLLISLVAITMMIKGLFRKKKDVDRPLPLFVSLSLLALFSYSIIMASVALYEMIEIWEKPASEYIGIIISIIALGYQIISMIKQIKASLRE